eukprot:1157742-Pelagomonas_calceolata.AAC.8
MNTLVAMQNTHPVHKPDLEHVIVQRAPGVIGKHPRHLVQDWQRNGEGDVAVIVVGGPAPVVAAFQEG